MNDSEETKKRIIEDYIAAYNDSDVEAMLKDMDERVVFRNVTGGTIDLLTSGIDEFRKQAELAKSLFSRREQKITALKFGEAEAEAEIDYRGTLAVDLPNGLTKGSEIHLNGRSVFRFKNDKIIELEDIA